MQRCCDHVGAARLSVAPDVSGQLVRCGARTLYACAQTKIKRKDLLPCMQSAVEKLPGEQNVGAAPRRAPGTTTTARWDANLHVCMRVVALLSDVYNILLYPAAAGHIPAGQHGLWNAAVSGMRNRCMHMFGMAAGSFSEVAFANAMCVLYPLWYREQGVWRTPCVVYSLKACGRGDAGRYFWAGTDGYLYVTLAGSGKHKVCEGVHRLIRWAVAGPPPVHSRETWDCMHVCHNPRCLNPCHLVWGARKHNVGNDKVNCEAAVKSENMRLRGSDVLHEWGSMPDGRPVTM